MKKKLTESEHKVLQLMCEGYCSKEISSKVFVSVRTLEGIRGKLVKRFDCKNSVQLVYKLSKKGMI